MVFHFYMHGCKSALTVLINFALFPRNAITFLFHNSYPLRHCEGPSPEVITHTQIPPPSLSRHLLKRRTLCVLSLAMMAIISPQLHHLFVSQLLSTCPWCVRKCYYRTLLQYLQMVNNICLRSWHSSLR